MTKKRSIPDNNPDFFPKKAMVFAAGIGTRMRPATLNTPKPLIQVAGKALIDHVLDRLAEDGVKTAVVNVHYLGDKIIAHLKNRLKSQPRPKIIISDERAKLLDQGGGIAYALPHLGTKPFFICNTDAFWIEGVASNLKRLARSYNPKTMSMSLLLAQSVGSIGVDWYGDFLMDCNGILSKRPEREVAPFAYAGVAIVNPELFKNHKSQAWPLAPLLFREAEKKRLAGIRLEGIWLHVGTPNALNEAESIIGRGDLVGRSF